MKRIDPEDDRKFFADPPEIITVTITANNTVFGVDLEDPLESGQHWTLIQVETPKLPVRILSFKMPNGPESFGSVYQFSAPRDPNDPGGQSYDIAFSSDNGTSDGPNNVKKAPTSSAVNLRYSFKLSPKPNPLKAAKPEPPKAPAATKATAKKAAKKSPKKPKKP